MLFSRRRNDLAIAGLVTYAGVLVAALTLFVLNPFSRTEIEQARQVAAAIAAAGHRAGTVVIPSKIAGQCRRLPASILRAARDKLPATNRWPLCRNML
jgi:hypothetical protein